MTVQLLTCPFCGNQPHFEGDVSDWKDDFRYVELSLVCCITMSEAIGWRRATDMVAQDRENELRALLIARWNTRCDSTCA